MTMAFKLRSILQAALFLIASIIGAGEALAHAALNGSTPNDGAVLAAAPAQLSLTYSEPVSPLILRLVGPDGKPRVLDRFVLKDQTIVIDPPPDLAQGTHVLSWRVVSADGHPIGGSVVFSIGAPGGAARAVDPQGGAATNVLTWLARFSLYLALFFGCGAVAYAAWIEPLPNGSRRLVWAFLALGAVTLPLALLAQGLDALGAPLGTTSPTNILKAATSTSFAATVAIAGAALLVAALALRSERQATQRAASIGALATAALAFAASGHASAATPQILMRPAVFVHAAAITAWAGALLPLAFALHSGEGLTALKRFSGRIRPIVAALLASGIALAVVQVERVSALTETAYGRVLLAKLALVTLLFLLAGYNRWRLTGRITKGEAPASRAMQRVIVAELVILLAVFCTAALWRFTPPPRSFGASAAQSAALHIHTLDAMADITITPGRVGDTSVAIVLMTGDFGPLVAKQLQISFANPGAGIEPIERNATRGEDGLWRLERLAVPAPGSWSVELEILISDFEMKRLQGTIEVKP